MCTYLNSFSKIFKYYCEPLLIKFKYIRFADLLKINGMFILNLDNNYHGLFC